MGFKFDGNRYITSGIQQEIPLALQLMMFESLAFMERKAGELDRLQIFKLETTEKDGMFLLNIRHEQEVPEAKIDIVVPVADPINEKVYIIDDVDHVTMLLAEEY
ncbi:MAG: DUF960 domain-containing protein [Ruminococcus sp.]|nr:DUF960 domain-containing protein [Ruminococcus sp.]